jgi:capsular polysaccharide biosynthesis protein
MRASRLTPWLLVATLTAAGAAAAAGYGLTAPKRYRATAKILVSPVSAGDPTFAGLGLLRDANGRHTAAASAASLVETPQVADAVRAQLGLRRSSTSLLDDVSAKVAKDSDVVLVTGDDSSRVGAAQLANAFVDALIAQRNSSFQSQLASTVQRDTQLLAAGSAGPQTAELARRLAVLRSFQGQPDPTLRRASTAIAPTSASWPNLLQLVLTGAGAGLAAAALLALALALVRRRGPAYHRPVDSTSEALVDRLEQRLAARESALAARERDLQARIDELRALEGRPADDSDLRSREQELAERERALAERVAAVTRRELAVARAAAAQATQPEPAPQPASPPAPVAAAAGDGAYNLTTLERLVQDRGGAHPDRAEEWDSYLYFLRDYAAADGSIPPSFDALVEETFRPLLG